MYLRNSADQASPAKGRTKKILGSIVGASAGLAVALSAIASVGTTPADSPDIQVSHQIMVMFAQESVVKDSGNAHVLATDMAALPFTMRSDHMDRYKNTAILAMIERGPETGLTGITDISANLEGVDTIIAPPLDANAAMTHIAVLPKERGKAQWQCLAQAIYFEARGETELGQRAVAEVILNRVDSRRWPNSVCRVVQQGAHRRHKCQFSYYCDGVPERVTDRRAFRLAERIAKEAIAAETRPLTKGATHYHATSVRPVWARALTKTAHYGTHIFYRYGTRLTQR